MSNRIGRGAKRASRPPVRAKSSDFKASRAICRRTDIFVPPPNDDAEHPYDIAYASGRHEGAIALSLQNAALTSHALALLIVLCDLYLRRQYRIIMTEQTGMRRRAITTTPKQLVEAVYGRGADGKKRYQLLGLERGADGGALNALAGALIKRDSSWMDSAGKTRRVLEAFHLIEGYRYHRVGKKEYLQVFLSDELQQELKALDETSTWTLVPGEVLRGVGPKKQQALRVAIHILSHAPIPSRAEVGMRREIGATALVGVIRPDVNRDPERYPGRYRTLLRGIVEAIDSADRSHRWQLMDASTDPLGKVVCLESERKHGNMSG